MTAWLQQSFGTKYNITVLTVVVCVPPFPFPLSPFPPFPLFSRHIRLRPGDTLYVPPYWSHIVTVASNETYTAHTAHTATTEKKKEKEEREGKRGKETKGDGGEGEGGRRRSAAPGAVSVSVVSASNDEYVCWQIKHLPGLKGQTPFINVDRTLATTASSAATSPHNEEGRRAWQERMAEVVAFLRATVIHTASERGGKSPDLPDGPYR